MNEEDREIHLDTDDARAGSTPNVVRWVLAIGLLLAVIGMSLAWIIPAMSRKDRNESVSAQINSQIEDTRQDPNVVPSSAANVKTPSQAPDEGAVPSVANSSQGQ